MASNDIQKLRQQYVFNPTEDISMGLGYDPTEMGYVGSGGGGISQNPYDPGPSPTFPDPSASIPAQASSGQAGMGAPPSVEAPKAPSYDPNASIQATIDAINRVYTPENVDRDRLRALMDAAPERNKPSLGRAIVAGGLSLKAADPTATAEKVLYAPYYRKLSDWKEKADPFYKTAQLENQANINERTLAGNVVTSVTAAERLAEQARVADQKNQVAMERNKINYIKANMGQGWKMNAHDGTTIKMWNTATGETKDTGISTRWMDESDKVDAEGEWSVKAAEARGEAGVKIAAAGGIARGEGTVIGSDNRAYRLSPDGTHYEPVPGLPQGTPNKLGPPARLGATNTLDARRQRSDALKNIYQYDEENRRWVKKGNNDTYDFVQRPIVQPKGWVSAEVTPEDVKAYDEFRHSIDPSYVPPPPKAAPKPAGGLSPSGTTKEAPAKPTGVGPGSTVPWGSLFGGGGSGDIELTPNADQHPSGVTVNAQLHRSPASSPQYALEDKAIAWLVQHNARVTDANVAHVIRTRLQSR